MPNYTIPKSHLGNLTQVYRKTWNSYNASRNRCYNPEFPHYNVYGGAGIRLSDTWINSFQAFLEYMGPKPEGTSLDRINSSGDYVEGNLRWATIEEQNNNPTNRRGMRVTPTMYVEHNGETKTVGEWCVHYSKDRRNVTARINYGWSLEEALDIVPRDKSNRKKRSDKRFYINDRKIGPNAPAVRIEDAIPTLTYKDQTLTILEWSKKQNIHYSTLRSRLRLGWTTAQALGFEPR